MSNLKPVREHQGTVLGAAALIVAIAALVVALIGVAGAASTRVIVRKGDIAPGAVTPKALAKGAVHARAIAAEAVHGRAIAAETIQSTDLASGSVNRRALKKEAVTTVALAPDAVTATQLAPGSVYGGALGTETLVTKPIADLDAVAANPEWTGSNAETALCGEGEKLLGTGFAFTNPGNREVGWLQALPIVSGQAQGVTGRITSNSGGTATAEVAAVCLK